MAVNPAFYESPQASERLLAKVNGLFTGCAISGTWTCYALATAGETTLTRDGSLKDRAQRKADLQAMLEGTGEPRRPNFNQSHVPLMAEALWPGGPKPDKLNVSWPEALETVKDGAILSLAVRLRQAPAGSPLVEFTRADHQITLRWRRGKLLRIDPMAPQGTEDTREVPPSHVKAAAVVNDPDWNPGGVVAFAYPEVGGWSAEALTRARLRERIRGIVHEADRTEARLRRRIAALEAAQPVPVDCKLKVAAALDVERVAIRDLVAARREANS